MPERLERAAGDVQAQRVGVELLGFAVARVDRLQRDRRDRDRTGVVRDDREHFAVVGTPGAAAQAALVALQLELGQDRQRYVVDLADVLANVQRDDQVKGHFELRMRGIRGEREGSHRQTLQGLRARRQARQGEQQRRGG
ncbi:MAG TPA: hypothetical protein VMH02_04905 [Verrucomicrobiae bacterium]|nr:hypothetical protein [Verrucomicrobiae bacterium]